MKSRIRLSATLIGVAALGLGIIMPGESAAQALPDPGLTSDQGVTPEVHEETPNCSELGFTDFELDVTEGDGNLLSWSASGDFLQAVILEGGGFASSYVYTTRVLSDSNLSPPIDPDSGVPFNAELVRYCSEVEVEFTDGALAPVDEEPPDEEPPDEEPPDEEPPAPEPPEEEEPEPTPPAEPVTGEPSFTG